jgi:hypothetical protein
MSCRDKHVIAWKSFEIGDGILLTEDDVKKISLGLIVHESQYVLIFFSVTSKYSVDEPIIYKLSEFKKTQVMKNKHLLLKICLSRHKY